MKSAELDFSGREEKENLVLFLSPKEVAIIYEALELLYKQNKRRKNIKKIITELGSLPLFY